MGMIPNCKECKHNRGGGELVQLCAVIGEQGHITSCEFFQKKDSTVECSLCLADFSIEQEGGVAGHLGILPTCFCSTCYAGVRDMVFQCEGIKEE